MIDVMSIFYGVAALVAILTVVNFVVKGKLTPELKLPKGEKINTVLLKVAGICMAIQGFMIYAVEAAPGILEALGIPSGTALVSTLVMTGLVSLLVIVDRWII